MVGSFVGPHIAANNTVALQVGLATTTLNRPLSQSWMAVVCLRSAIKQYLQIDVSINWTSALEFFI